MDAAYLVILKRAKVCRAKQGYHVASSWTETWNANANRTQLRDVTFCSFSLTNYRMHVIGLRNQLLPTTIDVTMWLTYKRSAHIAVQWRPTARTIGGASTASAQERVSNLDIPLFSPYFCTPIYCFIISHVSWVEPSCWDMDRSIEYVSSCREVAESIGHNGSYHEWHPTLSPLPPVSERAPFHQQVVKLHAHISSIQTFITEHRKDFVFPGRWLHCKLSRLRSPYIVVQTCFPNVGVRVLNHINRNPKSLAIAMHQKFMCPSRPANSYLWLDISCWVVFAITTLSRFDIHSFLAVYCNPTSSRFWCY